MATTQSYFAIDSLVISIEVYGLTGCRHYFSWGASPNKGKSHRNNIICNEIERITRVTPILFTSYY